MPSTTFCWDCEDLAVKIVGLDPDTFDIDDIEEKLYDKFNITFEDFCKLVENLIPFTVPMQSVFGNKYQGFVDCKENSFIVKVPYE